MELFLLLWLNNTVMQGTKLIICVCVTWHSVMQTHLSRISVINVKQYIINIIYI